MVYKSKIDLWLGLLLFIVMPCIAIIIPGYEFFSGDQVAGYIGLGAAVFYGALLFGLVLPTQYEITEDTLIVRHGLVRHTILLEDIQGVMPSRNLLSSPALSLDRLHVDRGTRLPLLISPKDKEGFLEDLARCCAHLKRDGAGLVKY